MEKVDICIIGAGVLGLAAAARLARGGRSVVVLEKAPRYGTETSSRNSEVIHAGIYYPPDSLKSRLCHEGRRRLYRLAADTGIFAQRTGKFIVATDEEETGRLEGIRDNAAVSGAENLELVTGAAVRKKIPKIKVKAALWCPDSGIIDSEELMGHFFRRAEDGGAVFLFQNAVHGIDRRAGGYAVTFGENNEKLHARWLINAAGLYADKIAQLAGVDIRAAGYRLFWCKGRYFRYNKEFKLPHLIYPVPSKHGLGVHLTPDRRGRVRLGPDTEFTDEIDYDVPAELAGKFAAAARRFWPGLREQDISPDTAGIRPKLTGPEGGFRDFVIQEESGRGLEGLINLIGVESPGLTASPAVAERVAAMIE
ncbi:MAG: NAD(P)/FAD-dependent oxidoreductase [Elusimicrobiota bacterium]